MQLTLYTYGDARLLVDIFSALATAVGDGNYDTLLRLMALFALAWVLFGAIFHNALIPFFKWFVALFLLYGILLIPKVTLNVYSVPEDSIQYSVDKVPLGIGLPASLASHIGFALTRMTEKAFRIPDSLMYQKTGLLFGSQLMLAATRFEVRDPLLSANLNQFFRQCVFNDLFLQRYTLDDLSKTNDLWQFFVENTAQTRTFMYNEQIQTCKTGAQLLNTAWSDTLQVEAQRYGRRLFPNLNSLQAQNALFNHLQIGTRYFTNLTLSGSQIMQQFLLLNAFKRAGKQDSTRNIHVNKTYDSLSLPQTVLSIFIYSLFYIVFPLFFLPMGARIAQEYFLLVFSMQCWAPLYAFLNMGLLFYAHQKSQLEMGYLNFFAQNNLATVQQDTLNFATYCVWLIPILSYGLLRVGAPQPLTGLKELKK